MPEPLGADGESFPDCFRACRLSGMVREAQTGPGGLCIAFAERGRPGAALVPTQTNTDDGRELGTQCGGFAEHGDSFLYGEVAHSVEYPVERETQFALTPLAGAFEAGEDRFKRLGIVIAPEVNHAHRDVNLCVDDTLSGESFHHAPGGQLIVIWTGKEAGDGFERLDKAGEVSELVELLGRGERDRLRVVASAQFHERGGRDGPFEVQMEFSLGEAANVLLNV